MCAQNNGNEHGLLWGVLHNKCPRCREGNLYTTTNPYRLKNLMKMPERCSVCGQKFELQTGFYFGTGFVSYGLSVLLSGVTFVLWWFTIGVSVNDNRILWWLAVNAIILVAIQPLMQRFARSLWISFFVRYRK